MTKKLFSKIPATYALSLLLVFCAFSTAKSQEDEVIATLDGVPINLSEVQESVAFQVYRLQGNIYFLLKRETEQIVNQKLLEVESGRRGLTVEELLQKEVDEKVPPLSDKAVDNYLADHPGDAGSAYQKRSRIRTYLRQKARNQRKLDYIASLREKADFKFLLNPPRRPRTKIDIHGEPWRGNPDAPVTLVHFASFSDKLCSNSVQMIRRVMAEYPKRIKWVHRNFFRMNDEIALNAAQMGESAHEHDMFWDFHDRLFAFEDQIDLEDILKVADDLGLVRQYNKDGRFLLKVKDDLRTAKRAGVTTVPIIFVNGLYFSPTFPYDKLKVLVKKELDGFADSSKSNNKASLSDLENN